MKKVLVITLIIMLMFVYGCKKNISTDENAVALDEVEISDETEGYSGDGYNAGDAENTDKQQMSVGKDEETIVKENAAKAETESEIEPEPETKPSEEGLGIYKEQQIFENAEDVYEQVIYPDLFLNWNGVIGVRYFGAKKIKTISYNGISYKRVVTESPQFPVGTEYENVNIGEFELTGETVEVIYSAQSAIDGYDTYKTETAELCKIPESMLNDKYVDMIAVKSADGKYELFYQEKLSWADDVTFYDYLKEEHIMTSLDCLTADKADAVKINQGGKDEIITDSDSVQKLYNTLVTSAFVEKCAFTKGDVYIEMRFKDGAGIKLSYFRESKTICVWPSVGVYDYGKVYSVSDEFDKILIDLI